MPIKRFFLQIKKRVSLPFPRKSEEVFFRQRFILRPESTK